MTIEELRKYEAEKQRAQALCDSPGQFAFQFIFMVLFTPIFIGLGFAVLWAAFSMFGTVAGMLK